MGLDSIALNRLDDEHPDIAHQINAGCAQGIEGWALAMEIARQFVPRDYSVEELYVVLLPVIPELRERPTTSAT